jgi:hypothetical protein
MSKTIVNLTAGQYDQAIIKCKDIFLKKMQDYGTAWRILRPSSLTDQIFIKAQRIRSIEEKQEQKIGESIESEFIGIINYAAIALVQLQLPSSAPMELEQQEAIQRIEQEFTAAKKLMLDKNHDYGEAWRDMRVSSMTDLILMKLLRIKQIEDHLGETIISEGVEANYYDIINYAVFALIKIDEEKINS